MTVVHAEAQLTQATRDTDLAHQEPAEPPGATAVTTVPIALLLPSDSPRLSGENAEHARALAASDKEFPPILVHRPTMRVIDGMHRLRVALMRNQAEIEVQFFHGSEADAFVMAVKANIGHGLPLTLAERTSAALRIIASHAEWSDRAISSATGLSATTVGTLRRRSGATGATPAARIGRDGRVRPTSTEEGRRTAGRLIAASPDAPLREIARKAGISPGTVRDVRNRLRRGEDPVPAPRATARPKAVDEDRPGVSSRAAAATAPVPTDEEADRADLTTLFKNLCKDPSLRHTEMGRLLLRMLDMQLTGAQCWGGIAQAVPPYRAEMVSAAAAQCARAWQELATQLAGRKAG